MMRKWFKLTEHAKQRRLKPATPIIFCSVYFQIIKYTAQKYPVTDEYLCPNVVTTQIHIDGISVRYGHSFVYYFHLFVNHLLGVVLSHIIFSLGNALSLTVLLSCSLSVSPSLPLSLSVSLSCGSCRIHKSSELFWNKM